jgi:hypothetical protein
MVAVGESATPGVDPRHDIVAEVRLVPAGGRRVQELAATIRCPAVSEDHDRWWHVAAVEQRIDQLLVRLAKRRPVQPHAGMSAVSGRYVDHRVPPAAVVAVSGRQVHQQRPLMRIAERVVPQQHTVDHGMGRNVR